MFCPKCGAQNPDGSPFCASCGAQLNAAQPQQPVNQGGFGQPMGNAGGNGMKLNPAEIINDFLAFFKNPVVSVEHYERLKSLYPDIVAYSVSDGYKLAAGWLIEKAGWKGRDMGRCGVYEKQALVLVNCGGCSGSEVLALADAVTDDVQKLFGVILEKEAIII